MGILNFLIHSLLFHYTFVRGKNYIKWHDVFLSFPPCCTSIIINLINAVHHDQVGRCESAVFLTIKQNKTKILHKKSIMLIIFRTSTWRNIVCVCVHYSSKSSWRINKIVFVNIILIALIFSSVVVHLCFVCKHCTRESATFFSLYIYNSIPKPVFSL